MKDLQKELKSKQKELEDVVAAVYKGKEKNVSKLKFLRKEVARVVTKISMEKKNV
ncbi:hypothetical protein ACFL13_00960 [Patescibacteria group bacterium]